MTDDAYKTMDNWLTPNGQKPPEPYIGMKMRVGNKYKIFNKTHELVYKAYKYDKDLLNDEMELLAWVWAHEGWDYDYGLQWNLKKVTHPETISRRRRELHEAGLITYSPKAMKSREQAFKNERDKASPILPQIKYELATINGERVMKVAKTVGYTGCPHIIKRRGYVDGREYCIDCRESAFKPEQTRLV